MIAVNDYVIIEKDRPEKMRGGLLLPVTDVSGNNIGAPYTGVVNSVGDSVSLVKENDRILFNDMCQPWIILDNDNDSVILIMKETDIIGILKND